MTGTTRVIGYNRSSNGPDLAKVEPNEQIVSHVQNNSPDSDFIAYAVKSYVGNWLSPATIRYGVWAAASASAAPGALLARTVSVNPTVNYVDAAGGQERILNLETPILIESDEWVAVGIGAGGNAAGVAMYQASAISQPNESFYRKGITGNNLESASGSTSSNEGQLAAAIFGEYNVAPSSPTNTSPKDGQSETSLTPNISADFNDANKTLNNGEDWDYAAETHIQFRQGSTVIWDYVYTTTSAERNSHRTVRRYAGPALLLYTTYNYSVRHRDRAGEWGDWSAIVYFSIRHSNRAPNLPTALTPSGDVSGSRSISMQATFSDPDMPALPDGQDWERLEAKRTIIRRASDNALIWDSGVVPVTTTERNAKRTTTTFTLPEWDVQYRWYIQHQDRAGAWSPFASALVKAVSGGSVDRPTAPSGFTTSPTNPGDIAAVYRNTGGLSANRIRVGVFSETGPLITQREVAKTVAPNGTISATWAELWSDIAVPGAPLGNGQTRLFAVAARATNGLWSDWSDFQTIITNAMPNTPSLYSRYRGEPTSVVPLIGVRADDDDSPLGSLTVSTLIYDASDTLLGTVTMPYLPESGASLRNVYGVAPTSVVTEYGTYKWQSSASDGYLSSPWSDMGSFVYAAVPSVTITSPTSPIQTSQPVITWTTPNQMAWRVQMRNEADELVYDTGEQSGAAQSHTISGSQYWIGGERWNNGEAFILTVMATDASTLWGSSEPLELLLSYTPPPALIIESATAMSLPDVAGTHYGQIVHSATRYEEAEFERYVTDRVEIDGPAGNDIPGTLISGYVDNRNPGDHVITDFEMTSNQWYRYATRQVVRQGIDIIESEPVFTELMVSFHGTLLHMPFDPINNAVWLQYGAVGGAYEPNRRRGVDDQSVRSRNRGAAHDYSGRGARTCDASGEYTFIPNAAGTAIQQLDTLDRLFDNQFADLSPDGRPHLMCWREGRGGRRGRLYVRLLSIEDRPSIGRTQSVALEFAERFFVPGSPAAGGDA